MATTHWPLTGLAISTPTLSLRMPSGDDLEALGELAAQGVHDPSVMPFLFPWTDAPPAKRARSTMQYHWRSAGEWKPEAWSLNLVVVVDGEIAGTQGMQSRDFAITREVNTGSWLGLRYQGRGIGTEMRQAVLHLAFDGLGATSAVSEAFLDNPSSLRVSRKLGYRDDGIERQAVRGKAVTAQRLRLDREAWEPRRRSDIDIVGLADCREMFGLSADPERTVDDS
ncbi:MAG: GCN5-like N-acetyltransferase [Jatrophihabitantaceae bacterium]|nr:GCN5-like N-acetyltransferase [Jatrophihabitantaceae bacterium]